MPTSGSAPSAGGQRVGFPAPEQQPVEDLRGILQTCGVQLEVQVGSLPRAVAEIDWRELTHETAYLKRKARLSGYVRLGARAEWIFEHATDPLAVDSGTPSSTAVRIFPVD